MGVAGRTSQRRAPARDRRAEPRPHARAAGRERARDHPLRHRGAVAPSAAPQARAELRHLARRDLPRTTTRKLKRHVIERAYHRERHAEAGRTEAASPRAKTTSSGRPTPRERVLPPSGPPPDPVPRVRPDANSNSIWASTRWNGWNCSPASSSARRRGAGDTAQTIFTRCAISSTRCARAGEAGGAPRGATIRGPACSRTIPDDPVSASC